METSAFQLLIVPTFWVTFGGVVAGSALLFLMRTAENAVIRFSIVSRSWRENRPIALWSAHSNDSPAGALCA